MPLCSTSADCAGEFPNIFLTTLKDLQMVWIRDFSKKGRLDNQHNDRKPDKAFVVSNAILDAIQFILNLRLILSMRNNEDQNVGSDVFLGSCGGLI